MNGRSWMNNIKRIQEAENLKTEGNNLVKTKKWNLAIAKYSVLLNLLKSNDDWEKEEGQKRTALIVAAYLNQAICFQNLKKYKEVIECCYEAQKLDKLNVKAFLRMGKAKLSLKYLDSAISNFVTVLDKIDSEDKDAKELLNEANQEMKKEALALDEYLEKAENCMQLNDLKGAHLYSEKALKLDNRNVKALKARGSIRYELGHFEGAGIDFDSVQKISSEDMQIAIDSSILQQYEKIISKKKTGKNEEEAESDARLLHVCIEEAAGYLDSKEYVQVIRSCRNCLELDNRNEKALCMSGIAKINLDCLWSAKEDIEAVLEINETNEDAQKQLTIIDAKLERHRMIRSKINYSNSLNETLNHRDAYMAICIRFIEEGHLNEAIDWIKLLKSISSDDCIALLDDDLIYLLGYDAKYALNRAKKMEDDDAFGFEFYFIKAQRLEKKNQDSNKKIERMRRALKDKETAMFNRISRKKDQFDKINSSWKSFIDEERFFQVLQNTVSMEGNSCTLKDVRQILKTKQTVRGLDTFEYKEVQEAELSIKFVTSSTPTNLNQLNKKFLLDLHKMSLGASQPLYAGQIRNGTMVVGSHEAPPAGKIQQLLDDFCDWLQHSAAALHPIDAAIHAHQRLAFIHPFPDGNGRVCRLVMNIILLMHGYPLVDIPQVQKAEYCLSLSMAEDSFMNPLKLFIMECIERTLDDYLASE